MRLLIVEDEKRLAVSLAKGLTAEGYAVDVVHDGVEGLHRASEGSYDLVILDIMLPGMNGYRVCGALRAAGHDVPVFARSVRGRRRLRPAGPANDSCRTWSAGSCNATSGTTSLQPPDKQRRCQVRFRPAEAMRTCPGGRTEQREDNPAGRQSVPEPRPPEPAHHDQGQCFVLCHLATASTASMAASVKKAPPAMA
ncbi:response regulator [Streptomyces europaeiscabiei]|uniref:response regulator n=1 Tax=Streptomyces europaeiscabiei TaxID=146819 RepID=UPI0039997797